MNAYEMIAMSIAFISTGVTISTCFQYWAEVHKKGGADESRR